MSADGRRAADTGADRFTAAWDEHHAALHRFILRRVADAAAADDLTQELFTRLWRAPVWPDHVGAWLVTSARRLVIDHYRARRALEPLGDLPAAEAGDEPVHAALTECLPAMLAQLPPPYREAVVMADLQRHPQQAVAEAQGVSLSGAKSRVQRGRLLLAAAYRDCCTFETAGGGLVDFDVKRPAACVFSPAAASWEMGMVPSTRNEP
jgi:RNA polymerase sigma-70 factor (ECF subfamily)